MKKSIPIFLFFCSSLCYAQAVTDFEAVSITNAADCKTAEPRVLEAANYMLSTPLQKGDVNRQKAFSLVMRWMTATPDYHFAIDEDASKLMKGSDDLLVLYMGAMTKYVLENKGSAADQKAVKVNAMSILLTYTDNPSNNVKPTKNLKKLSEAKANGRLEQEFQ